MSDASFPPKYDWKDTLARLLLRVNAPYLAFALMQTLRYVELHNGSLIQNLAVWFGVSQDVFKLYIMSTGAYPVPNVPVMQSLLLYDAIPAATRTTVNDAIGIQWNMRNHSYTAFKLYDSFRNETVYKRLARWVGRDSVCDSETIQSAWSDTSLAQLVWMTRPYASSEGYQTRSHPFTNLLDSTPRSMIFLV